MPVKVVKKGERYNIVEKGGKVVGSSKSKRKAHISAAIRNQHSKGKGHR